MSIGNSIKKLFIPLILQHHIVESSNEAKQQFPWTYHTESLFESFFGRSIVSSFIP